MKIKGNTVGTPIPRSNLNQTDPNKADYVIGREMVDEMIRVAYTEPIGPNTKVWINPNGNTAVAVLCSPQTLTDEQKAQAKANLGFVVDSALSLDSENPVQNKVITGALNTILFKGTDPITNIADDTPDYWRNLGAGAWEITGEGSKNIIDGNSLCYMGHIISLPGNTSISQLWVTPITQNIFIRSAGFGNTWGNTWKPLGYSKEELVQGVLDALPTWEGGAY